MRFAHLKLNMPKGSNKHPGLRGRARDCSKWAGCGNGNFHIHDTDSQHSNMVFHFMNPCYTSYLGISAFFAMYITRKWVSPSDTLIQIMNLTINNGNIYI